MFHTAFLSHFPLLHLPTLSLDDKPPILLRAMQACGALFVDTPEAGDFISETLNSARDQLLQMMVRLVIRCERRCLRFNAQTKASNDFEQQLYLIITGLLLQALDLQHSSFEKRASSNIYHGMLVMVPVYFATVDLILISPR